MFMDFIVLDKDMNSVGLIDSYESIIWTERFGEAGDFELYTPVTQEVLNYVTQGVYLFCNKFYDEKNDIGNLMIIESMTIESDPESGSKLTVTGRDLKSLLTRRIIWGQRDFKKEETTVRTMIEALINENLINPSDWTKTYQSGDTGEIIIEVRGETRRISNFELNFEEYEWPYIKEDIQFNGDTLYDAIADAAKNYGFGFEVLYDFKNEKFKIEVKIGRDCTYEQTENPVLIFSPNFENLKNSKYLNSSTDFKNSALVIGEGDEYNVMYNTIGADISGLDRREIAIQPSDVSRISETGSYEPVTPVGYENPKMLHWYELTGATYSLTEDTEVDPNKQYYQLITEYGNKTYLSMLLSKAIETMEKDYKLIDKYDGTAEETIGYEYLTDYQVGDICEIVNEWGISSEVTISEVVLSTSTSGQSIIPTFSSIEDDEGGEI